MKNESEEEESQYSLLFLIWLLPLASGARNPLRKLVESLENYNSETQEVLAITH